MTIVSTLREKILEAQDINSETIDVEEWGVKLLMRGMDGSTRARMVQMFMEDETPNFEKLYPELVILCSFDPDTNEQVFSKEDAPLLNQKAGAVLERVALIAMKVSGLDKEAVERGKDVSSTTPTTSSSSSSRKSSK